MSQEKREGEFLGKVTTSDGKEIVVYMPTMGDLEQLIANPTNISAYSLYALGANISVAEFRKLGLVDGQKIMNLMQKGAQALSDFFAVKP